MRFYLKCICVCPQWMRTLLIRRLQQKFAYYASKPMRFECLFVKRLFKTCLSFTSFISASDTLFNLEQCMLLLSIIQWYNEPIIYAFTQYQQSFLHLAAANVMLFAWFCLTSPYLSNIIVFSLLFCQYTCPWLVICYKPLPIYVIALMAGLGNPGLIDWVDNHRRVTA